MSSIYTQDNLIRKNERAAILNTPARYIGNVNTEEKTVWVHLQDKLLLEKVPYYNEGIERCFVELLSNCVDNAWRTRKSPYTNKCKATHISVTILDNEITIENDGNPLPAQEMEFTFMHSGSSSTEIRTLYPVTYYFGSMRTSTNYRKDEDRETTGLHGMGAKVVNVLSNSFLVISGDPSAKKSTSQSFQDHLNPEKTSEVSLKAYRRVNGQTIISFRLDESLFPGASINTMIPRIEALLINCSLLSGLCTRLNGKSLSCKNIQEYARLLGMQNYHCFSYPDTTSNEVDPSSEGSSIVCIGQRKDIQNNESSRGFLSFVNGLDTYAGGIHIDQWSSAILGSIVAHINKSKSAANIKRITQAKLREHLFIIVSLRISNPSFVGDTKERLIAPKPATRVLTKTEISRILKWSFYDEFIASMTLKDSIPKQRRERGNLKLGQWGEDAPRAGTRESSACTLLVVEGLSAKTTAVMGYSSLKDSACWGCLVLRGKIMNAQKNTQERVNNNKFMCMFRDMLGMRQGIAYDTPETVATLRYGRVMIFCDADEDGNHIAGLVLSLFALYYPYLLSSGFVTYLSTPVMKAYKTRIGSSHFHDFYTLAEYQEWRNSDPQGVYVTKHFKGLATSTKSDMISYFKSPKLIKFTSDDHTFEVINMAFGKSVVQRKKWIIDAVEHDEIAPDGIIHPSKFINTRSLAFSHYSMKRGLKCITDGLKDCQRKALFAAIKTGMFDANKQTRVSVLASRTVIVAHYDHGEKSLADAIIRMAQGFLGSNNIPLFKAIGGFGSRLGGRDSAAQARYPFVYLEPIAGLIFRREDEPFYSYNTATDVSGIKQYEPETYVPVIPFFLCNDGKGIACGFSMNNPPYNPLDVIELTRFMVKQYKPTTNSFDKESLLRTFADSLLPYWRGFKGTVKRKGKDVLVTGLFEITHTARATKVHITELPPGVWTDNFKRFLEDPNTTQKGGQRAKKIDKFWKKFTYTHSDTLIDFTLHCPRDESITEQKVLNIFGKLLQVTVKCGKIEYITSDGRYGMKTTVFDLVHLYMKERHTIYDKRIKYLIQDLEQRIETEKAIIRFIIAVHDRTIDLRDDTESIIGILESLELPLMNGSFNYLLDLKFSSINLTGLGKRQSKIGVLNEELEILKNTTVKHLWLKEIEEVSQEYEKLQIERIND